MIAYRCQVDGWEEGMTVLPLGPEQIPPLSGYSFGSKYTDVIALALLFPVTECMRLSVVTRGTCQLFYLLYIKCSSWIYVHGRFIQS